MVQLKQSASKLPIEDVTVIAPHFKRRLSGVTNSVKAIVPLQKALGLNIVAMGPGLPETMPRLYWKNLFAFWKKPKKFQFRIWHARRNSELIIGLLLRDILRLPLRVIFTFATQKKPNSYKNFLLDRADYIIATSYKNSAYLKQAHRLIMHGVDLEKFTPKISDKVLTNLPGKYKIGCFGRIRPSKGTDIFIKAMIELLPHYKDWTAIIVGRTTRKYQKFFAKLQEEIKQHNLQERILFFDEQTDLTPWYQALDLFVSPSLSEGFGLVALEALACGTPIIVSDVGAFPQMVQKTSGRLVKHINSEAFTETILSFFENPDQLLSMGIGARDLAERQFSLEQEALSLHKLYQDLWQGKI